MATKALELREGKLDAQLDALAQRSEKLVEQEALLAAGKLSLQASNSALTAATCTKISYMVPRHMQDSASFVKQLASFFSSERISQLLHQAEQRKAEAAQEAAARAATAAADAAAAAAEKQAHADEEIREARASEERGRSWLQRKEAELAVRAEAAARADEDAFGRARAAAAAAAERDAELARRAEELQAQGRALV